MGTAVALLRGVNVGGRSRLRMADLRALAEDLGLDEVRTHLQSGNLLFATPDADLEEVGAALEAGIAERFDLDVRVVTRSQAALAAVAAGHPFSAEDPAPDRLHVVFLAREPAPERVADLDPDRSPPDAFAVVGAEVYVHYPGGAGRSKLTADYFERKLATPATARSWRTVTKLQELL